MFEVHQVKVHIFGIQKCLQQQENVDICVSIFGNQFLIKALSMLSQHFIPLVRKFL